MRWNAPASGNGVAFRPEDAQAIYEEVPTWGPHPDVPAGLARVAKEIPLVILSNAMNSQIMSNVEKLGAPFHAVFTAEQTGTYKPRMNGFEYMLDTLGCGPEDITHVSSSFRYDLMTAYDLGIKSKVWVNRGHEPAIPTTSTPRSRTSAGSRPRSGSRTRGSRHEARVLAARHRAPSRTPRQGPLEGRPAAHLSPPSGRRIPAISAGP